ncbi:hypothetical protein G6F37_008582 [Rhizopus arrhizus]|nr:hypothetical protein G6F37_008582 [Rhizopus arrhizus]
MPGFSSTIYFPGLPDVTADLNAPAIATTLTAALFVLAMGISPVFWASLSDFYELRRFLFLCSMLIFAAASIGCAFVTNIWALVVLRCVQSVGASCGQSVGAGVVADCYPVERRGAAFGKYFFGVFFGPLLGPIIGGFLIMSSLTWRATFWFCFAFGLFVFILLFFAFPETYRIESKFDLMLPIAQLTKKAYTSSAETIGQPADGGDEAANKKETIESITISEEKNKEQSLPNSSSSEKKKSMNPIAPFFLLKHPFILLAAVASGIAFGCMFAVETITPDLYEVNYGFNSWKTGLSYLGGGVGNLLGAVVSSQTSDRLLLRARQRRGGQEIVEDRLSVTLWPAFFIFLPFGLLLFGWTIVYRYSVWAPIIGFGAINFGMNLVMTSTSAYLVDALPGQGASITAAANLVRMVFACVLTIAANPMVAAIGAGIQKKGQSSDALLIRKSRRDSDDEKYESSRKRSRISELSKKNINSIDEDDYFEKATEFRLWLKEYKDVYFDELSSKDARRYFKKFVKKWNRYELDEKYYNGLSSAQLDSSDSTRYKWSFAKNLDKMEMNSIRDSVDSMTSQSRGDDKIKMIGKRRNVGPSLPDTVDREEEYEKHRTERKYEARRKKDRREAMLDEVAPREIGREAQLLKKRALNAYHKRERSPDVELSEADLMGGDDFQAREK